MELTEQAPGKTRAQGGNNSSSCPPTQAANLPYGLSVDVEDYFHVEAFADQVSLEMWPNFARRVVDNTRRVLELFSRTNARATFFILGWVAEKEPKLLQEIVNAGHEIGCHSFWHRRLWRMTPEEFREDTRRALNVIQDACGQKVVGYRAPTFSLVRNSLWAVEILAEEGFLYDSSVYPIHHDLYGMPEAPRFPFRWECSSGPALSEIPLTTIRLLGWNFPVGGGGYLRILPMWYTRWALNRVRNREGKGAVLYFHPWELDPGQPRFAGKWRSRFRHYFHLGQMEKRLGELLRNTPTVGLHDFLNAHLARGPLPPYPLKSA
jgi:polysaccharide deacetylase family protein (PEP-CTERM system associated)